MPFRRRSCACARTRGHRPQAAPPPAAARARQRMRKLPRLARLGPWEPNPALNRPPAGRPARAPARPPAEPPPPPPPPPTRSRRSGSTRLRLVSLHQLEPVAARAVGRERGGEVATRHRPHRDRRAVLDDLELVVAPPPITRAVKSTGTLAATLSPKILAGPLEPRGRASSLRSGAQGPVTFTKVAGLHGPAHALLGELVGEHHRGRRAQRSVGGPWRVARPVRVAAADRRDLVALGELGLPELDRGGVEGAVGNAGRDLDRVDLGVVGLGVGVPPLAAATQPRLEGRRGENRRVVDLGDAPPPVDVVEDLRDRAGARSGSAIRRAGARTAAPRGSRLHPAGVVVGMALVGGHLLATHEQLLRRTSPSARRRSYRASRSRCCGRSG